MKIVPESGSPSSAEQRPSASETSYSPEGSTPATGERSTPTIRTTERSDSPSRRRSSAATRARRRPGETVRPLWLAGFLDGEGNFIIEKKKRDGRPNYYYPRLCATNTNKQVLRLIASQYGGTVRLAREGTVKHRDCWRWTLSGLAVYDFLRRYRARFIVKRLQAGLMFRFCQYWQRDPDKQSPLTLLNYKRHMTKLNRRGPVANLQDDDADTPTSH